MLEDLRERITGAVFVLIYIREAHAVDVWPIGAPDQPSIQAPTTTEERLEVAARFQAKSCWRGLQLVDGYEDSFENAFAAWPFRFFAVTPTRRLLYKAQPTPELTYCPCDLEAALRCFLDK